MTRENVDFLSLCVASRTGNPILEQIREHSAEAVLAIYRLVKNALVHALDNDAVTETVAQSCDILVRFAAEVGTGATVTFVEDTVFVSGQLLRASRKVYESALELGGILGRCGISEVVFSPALNEGDLLAFAGALVAALRDPDQRRALLDLKLPSITVRQIDRAVQRRDDDADRPLEERILKLYALALMVMRQHFDQVANGTTVLPHRIKRVAQRLVVLSESGHPALLGMTAVANAPRDDAGRAVHAAILSLAIGRQLTQNRVVLAQLAMTALLSDLGRVRLAGPRGRDLLVPLPEADERKVPLAATLVTIQSGGVNVANALRTVVIWETTWQERRGLLGDLGGGQALLPQSSILYTVRALLELLVPRDSSRPLSPVAALAELAQDKAVNRELLRLLMRAVGVVPVGSVLELATGEWAVVVGPSENNEAHGQPKLRLVTDGSGNALPDSQVVDLGRLPPNSPPVRITRVIEPGRADFNLTRSFFAG